MNREELYRKFLSDLMSNIEVGQAILDELVLSERYLEDYEFRAFVDTGQCLIYSIKGDFLAMLKSASELVERATLLEIWELLSFNLNLMGGAYFALSYHERAMEYYWKVIKVEEKYGLNSSTGTAYSNIAIIYLSLNDYQKAYEYFCLVVDLLESSPSDQARLISKKVFAYSYIIQTLCELGRIDEIPPVLEKIEKLDLLEITDTTRYSYHAVRMVYYFHAGDFEQAKEEYYRSRTFIQEYNQIVKGGLLSDFLVLCRRFGRSEEFYKEELMEIKEIEQSGAAFTHVQLYSYLRKYYEKNKDIEHYDDVSEKYIQYLEQNMEDSRVRQLSSLQIVEHFVRDDIVDPTDASRNKELQLIADEAIRHKKSLENTYRQLEMINELGQKVTSSLDIDEVVGLIYKYFNENVPVDTFMLMVAEPEFDQLRSVVYYEGDEKRPDFHIAFDDPNSLFAECYRNNRLVCSVDFENDPQFAGRKLLSRKGKTTSRSALFLPLNLGNRVIGACSIQHQEKYAYTEAHIAFLQALTPYLAIALNNAVRSWTLEKEIQSHRKAQQDLRDANKQLNQLSSLDSLTQINNRRAFEKKILDMIHRSKEQDEMITIFMIDIDNFKLYNDTYGHLEGDEALKQVALKVRQHMDEINGISARFGGEEFIGACLGLNAEQSEKLADRMRQDVYDLAIENRLAPNKNLSISIGVAVAQSLDISQKSDIMRWADASLYHAKHTGRNRVILKKMVSGETLFDE